MTGRCGCAKCHHPVFPPIGAEPPYDEMSHEVDNNVLSIRVAKEIGQVLAHQDNPMSPDQTSPFDVICADANGNQCRNGCTKVNVIPNKQSAPRRPEEEMFLIRMSKQIMNADDLKYGLEVEFKAPRNYLPLPDPGPPPPIIQVVSKKGAKSPKGKKTKKGKKK